MLPFWVRVDFRAMVMKRYFTYPKARSWSLAIRWYNAISRAFVGGGKFTPQRRCSQSILWSREIRRLKLRFTEHLTPITYASRWWHRPTSKCYNSGSECCIVTIIYIYNNTHMHAETKSTIMTNKHSSLEKYTSHTLFERVAKRLCVRRELENKLNKLQHIDPHFLCL